MQEVGEEVVNRLCRGIWKTGWAGQGNEEGEGSPQRPQKVQTVEAAGQKWNRQSAAIVEPFALGGDFGRGRYRRRIGSLMHHHRDNASVLEEIGISSSFERCFISRWVPRLPGCSGGGGGDC